MLSILAIAALVAAYMCAMDGQVILACVALTVPWIYFIILGRDMALLKHCYAGLAGRSKVVSIATMRPWLSFGRTLLQLAEALRYRIAALDTQIDGLAAERLQRTKDALPESAERSDSAAAPSERQLYTTISKRARPSLHADAVAIVWREEGKGEPRIDCVVDGAGGARLLTEIEHFGQAVFSKVQSASGIMSAKSVRRECGDFTFFGYSSLIAYEFTWKKAESTQHGVLCAGYKGTNTPTPTERKLAKQYAEKIEADLPAIYKLYELSGRVIEAETSSNEKSEFLAQMSHDIRGPLYNMCLALETLQDRCAGQEEQQIIQEGLNNAQAMSELLETVLDFSRHRVGKLEAQKEPVDVRLLIGEVLEIYTLSARQRNNVLALNPAQEEIFVSLDRRHFKRILGNLLSNAIKFTQGGRITIGAAVTPNSICEITVQDSGRGMSAEQLTRLFTPFTRFNAEGIHGIGLGLALTKVLVEKNDGTIAVSSEENKGTTFSVMFPITVARSRVTNEPTSRLSRQSAPLHSGSGCSVLLVDDDPLCTETLSKYLSRYGYEVHQAASAADAQAIVRLGGIDAVISDAQMPGGGAQALLEFHATLGGFRPALMVVTGNDDADTEKRYRMLGASEVMFKPASPSKVLEWLQQVTQKGVEELRKTAN